MSRAEVVSRLELLEPSLRAHGVAGLYLYGSHARDDAGPDSDIDILTDFAPGHEPDLARFMRTSRALEEAFPGTVIGFATRASLEPAYRLNIERSAFRVF